MKEVLVTTSEGALLSLAGAILVYRGPRHVLAMLHGIDAKPDHSIALEPGVPITQAAATQLLQGLELSLTYRGFVPQRLLAIGPGAMAWWLPPGRRTVYFDDSRKDGLGKRQGPASHPGLVFAATGSAWFVWAVKGRDRPTEASVLHYAPYFNVWADRGQVCTGNVELPRACGPEAMDGYERAFFESRFTHPNDGFKVRFKGGGIALWRSLLADRGRSPFPQRALAPSRHTLGAFVRHLMENPHED